MNIDIYQVNMERDTNRIAFMDYDSIARFQGSPDIDCKVYDKVFEGDVDCNTLEEVYQKFNLDHPKGYKGRSLSVSDVVEVKDKIKVDIGFYYCNDIGFRKVDFHPEECAELENARDESKITVLVIEPGKKPKLTEIGSSLEEMQAVVGGDIEEYMPFDDDVAIICNEEGKMIGLPLNRAIYSEPTITDMDYGEMTSAFREAERNGQHITGYIVFTEDSFDKPYPIEARTYAVSSDNKAFQPNMGGYSIYGSSLDGKDMCVRLEGYMEVERGGHNGWRIEKCYTKDENREMVDIVAGTFFIAYAPVESEKFLSLPKDLADKYAQRFKYPETFFKVGNEIQAIPMKPNKDRER